MPSPRVFLMEPPRKNYDPANLDSFGEIVYIFDRFTRGGSPFKTDTYIEAVINKVDELKFVPDDDFLCIAGSLVTLIIGITALLKKYKRINVLMYDWQNSHYIARRLTVEDNAHAFS